MELRQSPDAPRRNRVDGASSASRNRLLRQLPQDELAAFLEQAEEIRYPLHAALFEQGETITEVFFPLTGMASLVTVLKDGTALEAMAVGREGFTGIPLLNGITTHRFPGMCQIEGEFVKVTADRFADLLDRSPRFGDVLRRYAQLAHETAVQSAACNGIHRIEQRCARWLLTTADAVDSRKFTLTQEFLSQMLGVRRAGVTVAVGALERQRVIAHRYGNVEILDWEGLRKAACECYDTIAAKSRELLGGDGSPS